MTKRCTLTLAAMLAAAGMASTTHAQSDDEMAPLRGPSIGERDDSSRERAGRPGRFSEDRAQSGKRGARGGDPEGRRGQGRPPKELMERFDTDGDGQLSETEREALKAEMQAKRAAFIKPYDIDGDGELSEAEATAMKAELKSKLEAMKAELVAEFDADGDGKLTGEERKAAGETARARVSEITGGFAMRGFGDKARRGQGGQRGQVDREAMKQQLIEKFDANGDGELTGEEREAAAEAMRKLRPRGQRGNGQARGEGRRGRVSDEAKAELLERFDADGDGKLTGDERKAAGEAMRQRSSIARALRSADTNRDGVIDSGELTDAASLIAEGSRRADFNRDGEVNNDDLIFLTEKAGGL